MLRCMFIVWYSLESSRLRILHPWYRNSVLYSLISSRGIQHLGTFCAFATAIENHYNLAFSFHQVPITAGWTEAAWYDRLAQHNITTSMISCYINDIMLLTCIVNCISTRVFQYKTVQQYHNTTSIHLPPLLFLVVQSWNITQRQPVSGVRLLVWWLLSS